MASGYAHAQYARSFAEFGVLRPLVRSGGWLLERPVPGSSACDAIGGYPLFDCERWEALGADLADLCETLVSVTCVVGPRAGVTDADLRLWFDHVVVYKPHYLVNLEQPPPSLPRRHRRNLRWADDRVTVRRCEAPLSRVDEWTVLYRTLCRRHSVTGIRAFSKSALEQQLHTPGLVMYEAYVGSTLAGIHLWLLSDDVGYGHLGATSDAGYEARASYALYRHAIADMRGQTRWLDLGGAPDSASPARPGLDAFKSGWATHVQPSYICGRILQPDVYAGLVAGLEPASTPYFPAYRHRESGMLPSVEAPP